MQATLAAEFTAGTLFALHELLKSASKKIADRCMLNTHLDSWRTIQ